MDGFSSASPPRIFWKSRKRSGNGRVEVETLNKETSNPDNGKMGHEPMGTEEAKNQAETKEKKQATDQMAELSEKRKALFEPLEPTNRKREKHISNEDLLPPPDFDTTLYPKGWLAGKKRKLVNVDVVEIMRHTAIQEMNRKVTMKDKKYGSPENWSRTLTEQFSTVYQYFSKDREIDGLNEQMDEDARLLQHLQVQLVEEKRKRVEAEREKEALQQQVSVLTNMLSENQAMDEEEYEFYNENSQGLGGNDHEVQ